MRSDPLTTSPQHETKVPGVVGVRGLEGRGRGRKGGERTCRFTALPCSARREEMAADNDWPVQRRVT